MKINKKERKGLKNLATVISDKERYRTETLTEDVIENLYSAAYRYLLDLDSGRRGPVHKYS